MLYFAVLVILIGLCPMENQTSPEETGSPEPIVETFSDEYVVTEFHEDSLRYLISDSGIDNTVETTGSLVLASPGTNIIPKSPVIPDTRPELDLSLVKTRYPWIQVELVYRNVTDLKINQLAIVPQQRTFEYDRIDASNGELLNDKFLLRPRITSRDDGHVSYLFLDPNFSRANRTRGYLLEVPRENHDAATALLGFDLDENEIIEAEHTYAEKLLKSFQEEPGSLKSVHEACTYLRSSELQFFATGALQFLISCADCNLENSLALIDTFINLQLDLDPVMLSQSCLDIKSHFGLEDTHLLGLDLMETAFELNATNDIARRLFTAQERQDHIAEALEISEWIREHDTGFAESESFKSKRAELLFASGRIAESRQELSDLYMETGGKKYLNQLRAIKRFEWLGATVSLLVAVDSFHEVSEIERCSGFLFALNVNQPIQVLANAKANSVLVAGKELAIFQARKGHRFLEDSIVGWIDGGISNEILIAVHGSPSDLEPGGNHTVARVDLQNIAQAWQDEVSFYFALTLRSLVENYTVEQAASLAKLALTLLPNDQLAFWSLVQMDNSGELNIIEADSRFVSRSAIEAHVREEGFQWMNNSWVIGSSILNEYRWPLKSNVRQVKLGLILAFR